MWQRHAERRLRAELTVVFDPNDPGCVQDRATHPQRDLQLRLRATNTGTVVLTGVRDRLRSRHDHIGRIRHDNDPTFERSHGGVTLQVGASEYFDIAFARHDSCWAKAVVWPLAVFASWLWSERIVSKRSGISLDFPSAC